MTLQAGDKLMSLGDVSEMLGIPVHTLYRWRYKGRRPSRLPDLSAQDLRPPNARQRGPDAAGHRHRVVDE